MRIAICDDEKEFTNYVRDEINNSAKSLMTKPAIDIYYNGHDLLDNFRCQYDIIFQDINLLDSNGFEIAKKIREFDRKVAIVFLTSIAEYVFDGYKVNAMRYILKEKVKEEITPVIETILKNIALENSFITLMKRNKFVKLFCCDIVYIVSELRKINIVTRDNIYVEYSKITKYDKILMENEFVRTHQGYLVNSKYIKTFTSGFVILDDDTKIPVSRNNIANVKKKVMEYLH